MAGLYLHIPFCKQACHYCDFHFSTDPHRHVEMVGALAKEIALQRVFLREPLQTIYFGGGTPSLLNQESVVTLVEAIQSNFPVAGDAEITLEANPDDLNFQKVKDLKGAGVNRLSMGIQSFDDVILRYLNRAHDSHSARQSLIDAREAGISNISIDLIYAIPGLSLQRWKETLQQALRFDPQHISSYALTIEEKTVFGNWRKRGRLRVVDEEKAAAQFEMLLDMMASAGYEHYEISNFCRPGYHSRHNSSYWNQTHYLGIGPSAHSFDGTSRYFNVCNNALYLQSINKGVIPFESEMLTLDNKINEYILTRLRTQWGCDLQYLQREFGDDLMTRCSAYLHQFLDRDLMRLEQNTLLLTRKGKLLADKITEDLMI